MWKSFLRKPKSVIVSKGYDITSTNLYIITVLFHAMKFMQSTLYYFILVYIMLILILDSIGTSQSSGNT